MTRFIPLGLAIATCLFLAIKGMWIGIGVFLAAMGLTMLVLKWLNK